MKQTILIVAWASALALTACQSGPRIVWVGDETDMDARLIGRDTAVLVDDDPSSSMDSRKKRVSVDQEPIYAQTDPQNSRKNKITWRLQRGYQFPMQGGIEICPRIPPASQAKRCATPPQTPPDCERVNDRKITCRYDKPASGTLYYYTVRVLDGSTVVELDPSIWN